METAVAAGVGALDIAAEEIDARQGYSKPFQNATDLARTGVTVGSAIANYMNLETKYSSAAFYAGLPLFEKTLYKTTVSAKGGSTSVRRGVPAARSVAVRSGQASGIQALIPQQQIGNYRSITS